MSKKKQNAEKSISEKDKPQWLNADDLAKKFKTHIVTVREWIRDGKFPNACRKIEGRKRYWLIPAGDLENFTPRRKGAPTTENPAPRTILKRAQRAQSKIKEIYGYGKKEIFEMIELEKEGISRAEIAARYRIELNLVDDILEKAAVNPPRVQKKHPVKRELKRLPKDLLIELYAEKELSVKYILERLDTNFASLYINLRYYGIPLRHEHYRLSAEEMEQALWLLYWQEKKTPAEIAANLNLSESYIKRKLKELKITQAKL